MQLNARTYRKKKRGREIETVRYKWIYWPRRKRLLPVAGFRCWVSFYISRLIVFQFNNTSLVASPCPYFFHQTIIVFRDARMVAIFPISMFSFGFFVSRVSITANSDGNRSGINVLLLSTCLQLIENFKMKTTLASQGI